MRKYGARTTSGWMKQGETYVDKAMVFRFFSGRKNLVRANASFAGIAGKLIFRSYFYYVQRRKGYVLWKRGSASVCDFT